MAYLQVALRDWHQRWHDAATTPSVLLATFTLTMFTSAMLLFSVQPMFAKMALPMLGGTPAVWAVSMCFFQATLLAGYCYAHVLNHWLERKRAVIAHLAVLTLTYVMLPIGLPSVLADPPQGDAYFWLLGVLAIGVGLPFFAVSASAPLLQAWFSKTGHKDAHDPYFLYGASNFGSLIALLAYPFVLEPVIGLQAQSMTWFAGFIMLHALVMVCGLLMLTNADDIQIEKSVTPETGQASIGHKPAWQQRFVWIALAAIPSAMMVAVTTHITTDLVSAPFIWVVPLALFLSTFIMVFRAELPFNYKIVQYALPAAILLHIVMPNNMMAVVVSLLAFLLAAILCHRQLYELRPEATHLTEFYIWMSVGGALGGVFSALIAPHIFTSVIEFDVLLLLSLLARPDVFTTTNGNVRISRIIIFCAIALTMLFGYKAAASAGLLPDSKWFILTLIATACFGVWSTRKWPEHRPILILSMIMALFAQPAVNAAVYAERSFFGTIKVIGSDRDRIRTMLHGTTVHGAQFIRDAEGKPTNSTTALTYYYAGSSMHRGILVSRAEARAAGRQPDIGIVGLGTGSLSCYAEEGESWRFYEIDPMVARVAQDPELFNFLPKCMPDADIVFGDARVTLAKEDSTKFDYLLIDAFSSDSIPAHLITREAFELYLKRLRDDGLLAIHISNRYLDLTPAISATLAQIPGVSAAVASQVPHKANYDDPNKLLEKTANRVIFASRNPDVIARLTANDDTRLLTDSGANPWTDDYSDILTTFYHGMTK